MSTVKSLSWGHLSTDSASHRLAPVCRPCRTRLRPISASKSSRFPQDFAVEWKEISGFQGKSRRAAAPLQGANETVRTWAGTGIHKVAAAVGRHTEAFAGVDSTISPGDSVSGQDCMALTRRMESVADMQEFMARAAHGRAVWQPGTVRYWRDFSTRGSMNAGQQQGVCPHALQVGRRCASLDSEGGTP